MQNKYDTDITLEENSSLTYMLKNIESCSTVLEFGPATGYMTRYLKEEMQCQVYIVEIDREAFEKANIYAADGICGSAEDKGWLEKFQNIRFDYITFADVLEHLIDPWKVLEWSVKLLKENTGKILVSIPNIGHNAVLVDLLNNKFEYRTTGIMDNTHLRFFTHDSAVEMFHKCGLYIVNEDEVVFNLEYAGFGNSEQDISENLWWELQLRKYGFVNQFLFTLDTKTLSENSIKERKQMLYECALYYTKGSEYCEKQKELGTVKIKENQFYAEISFDQEVECKLMMIELFAFPGTISGMTIESNVVIEQIKPINGRKDSDDYCFWGDKIKIQMECKDVQILKYVHISGKLGTVQTRQLGEYIIENEHEYECNIRQEELEIQRLNQVVEKKDKALSEQVSLLEEKDKVLSEQTGLLKEMDKTIYEQTSLLKERNKELAEQAVLLEERNKIICEQKIYLEEKDKVIAERIRWLEEKDKVITEQARWLEEKDKVITEQVRWLEEKDKVITEQVRWLEEKDKVITEQARWLEEKDKVITEQARWLEEKDKVITEQVFRLEEKDIFIQKIKATRWFRMFEKQILKDK